MENKKIFYKIVEVSKKTGIPPHVLRYWEKEYKFIKPKRSRDGKRLYKSEDIDKILKLKSLLKEGLTLKSAVNRLKTPNSKIDSRQILKEIKEDLQSILKILS